VIQVKFALHRADGDVRHPELPAAEEVPRVGELMDFQHRAFQVIDVHWHLWGANRFVVVTARECDLVEHVASIAAQLERNHRRIENRPVRTPL